MALDYTFSAKSVMLMDFNSYLPKKANVCLMISFGDGAVIFTKLTNGELGVNVTKCNGKYVASSECVIRNIVNPKIGLYKYITSGSEYTIDEPVDLECWNATFLTD